MNTIEFACFSLFFFAASARDENSELFGNDLDNEESVLGEDGDCDFALVKPFEWLNIKIEIDKKKKKSTNWNDFFSQQPYLGRP